MSLARSPSAAMLHHSRVPELAAAVVELDREEQMKAVRCWTPFTLLHPHSVFKVRWDMVLTVLILYSVCVIPFRIGFDEEATGGVLVFDICIDVFFGIDILVNLYSGIYDEYGVFVDDHRRIVSTYLKGWFIIDFCSTVPVDRLVGAFVAGDGDEFRSLKLIRVLRLIRLLKLARLFKLSRIMQYLESVAAFNPAILRLLRLLFEVIFIAHFLSCFWHLLPTIEGDGYQVSWYQTAGVTIDSPVGERYVASMYWAVATMMSVGFGDIHSTTTVERLYSIFVQMIGVSFFGFIVANMSSLLDSIDARATAFRNKVSEVQEYMHDRKLPMDLQRRILAHYKHFFAHKSLFAERAILDELSNTLRNQLVYHSNLSTIKTLRVFRKADINGVSATVLRMHPRQALEMELLMNPGDAHNEILFIQRGVVEAFAHVGPNGVSESADPEVLGVFSAGETCGHEDLNLRNRHAFGYRAATAVEAQTLSLEDFHWLDFMYPSLTKGVIEEGHELGRLLRAARRNLQKLLARAGPSAANQQFARARAMIVNDGELRKRRDIPGYMEVRQLAKQRAAKRQVQAASPSGQGVATREPQPVTFKGRVLAFFQFDDNAPVVQTRRPKQVSNQLNSAKSKFAALRSSNGVRQARAGGAVTPGAALARFATASGGDVPKPTPAPAWSLGESASHGKPPESGRAVSPATAGESASRDPERVTVSHGRSAPAMLGIAGKRRSGGRTPTRVLSLTSATSALSAGSPRWNSVASDSKEGPEATESQGTVSTAAEQADSHSKTESMSRSTSIRLKWKTASTRALLMKAGEAVKKMRGGDDDSSDGEARPLTDVELFEQRMRRNPGGEGGEDVIAGKLVDTEESALTVLKRGIILSTYPPRLAWDVLMLIVTLGSVLLAPYRLSFDSKSSPTTFGMELFTDIIFGIDILINFRTSYLTLNGQIHMTDPGYVRRYYLRTWFTADFLSTFPFELIYEAVSGTDEGGIVFVKLLRLFKLLRVVKLSKHLGNVELSLFVSPTVIRLCTLLFQVSFLAHLMGCFLFLVSSLADSEEDTWWYALGDLSLEDKPGLYVAGIYWAFTTMTTVGYGDIQPTTIPERIYASVCIVLGATVFGFIVGSVTSLVARLDSRSQKSREKMEEVRDYLREKNVPSQLWNRVHKYYEYLFTVKSVYDEDAILSELTPALRNEVVLFLNRDIIETIPFFEGQDDLFKAHVGSALTPQFFPPGEVVFHEGEVGSEMYFLVRGTLEVVGTNKTTGEEVVFKEMGEGSYFGELALVLNQPRSATIRAKTHLNLFALTKSDIAKLLSQYPTLRPQMRKALEKSLEGMGASAPSGAEISGALDQMGSSRAVNPMPIRGATRTGSQRSLGSLGSPRSHQSGDGEGDGESKSAEREAAVAAAEKEAEGFMAAIGKSKIARASAQEAEERKRSAAAASSNSGGGDDDAAAAAALVDEELAAGASANGRGGAEIPGVPLQSQAGGGGGGDGASSRTDSPDLDVDAALKEIEGESPP